MKKAIQILAVVLVVMLPMILAAQPQPWDPGLGGGEGANPVGAPIGGGLLIMLSLAIGYGARKVFNARKKVME